MANVPTHIFREYDIRGIAEEELTDPTVRLIGRGYGAFLAASGIHRVPVAGDVRLSTPRIRAAAVEGLRDAGIDVVDLGPLTTPAFYWSLYHLDCHGGIMVTGSHNPKEFNGLKLAFGKLTLYGDQIQEIRRIIETDAFVTPSARGALEHLDIGDAYVDMLLGKISLGSRPLTVALDAGNGTAGLFLEKFFGRLGCRVISLFEEPDGNFPNHHPDPTVRENLPPLIDTVRQHKADVGMGFDGDADRLGVVDDQGEVLWGDQLMALYWREILPKHPGADAIIEVKSSQLLVDEVLRLGGKPQFWKSGHSLVKARMQEIGALFSGEVSGHMFFADEFFGFDDSFYAAGRLLRILSSTPEPLSAMAASLPRYYSTAETRFPCPDDQKFAVVERVKEEALRDFEAVTVDGVRILYPTGWGLLRASNTQPILVARAEGKTPEDLERNARDLKERIERAGGGSFDWTY